MEKQSTGSVLVITSCALAVAISAYYAVQNRDILISTSPDGTSSDSAWIAWYKKMRQIIGKKNANVIFAKYWEKLGQKTDANTHELRTQMESLSGLVISPSGIIGNLTEIKDDFFDSLESIFSMGKTAVIIVGLVIVIPIAIFLINLARKPDNVTKIAGTAAKFAI